MHLTATFHHPTFNRSEVIMLTNKQTDNQTDRPSTSLRYATPVGNKQRAHKEHNLALTIPTRRRGSEIVRASVLHCALNTLKSARRSDIDMWCALLINGSWSVCVLFSVVVAYRSPRLIAEPARQVIYKRGHRLVLPCHAVGTPQPTYDFVKLIIIRLHRSTTYVDAAYCYRPSSVVCRSDTLVSPARTAAPIEMPFGSWARMGRRNRVIDGGPAVLRDVVMATNFGTQFATIGFVDYNFGCMIANDTLFDSRGGFRGQPIRWRHAEIEYLRVVAMATNFGTKIAINWLRVNVSDQTIGYGGGWLVGRQNADIADTLHLWDVAMATTFWLLMNYNFSCMSLATRCLILGVRFRGQAIRWRHSRFRGSQGHCHGNHFWLYMTHIGATWRIRLNRPRAAAMRPYVKFLWPLVFSDKTWVYQLVFNRTL